LVLNGDNTIEFLHKYNNHIWDKDIADWNGVDAGKTMVSNGELTLVKLTKYKFLLMV
jgi:hypothetical protein